MPLGIFFGPVGIGRRVPLRVAQTLAQSPKIGREFRAELQIAGLKRVFEAQ